MIVFSLFLIALVHCYDLELLYIQRRDGFLGDGEKPSVLIPLGILNLVEWQLRTTNSILSRHLENGDKWDRALTELLQNGSHGHGNSLTKLVLKRNPRRPALNHRNSWHALKMCLLRHLDDWMTEKYEEMDVKQLKPMLEGDGLCGFVLNSGCSNIEFQ